MKYTILLCFWTQICFSQKTIFDTIYLNENFRSVHLSEDQKGIIADEFTIMKSNADTGVPGEYLIQVNPKINLFAHSILSEDQKVLFDTSWRERTSRLIHSNYHYLMLSDPQKDQVIKIMQNVDGYDTLKITVNYPDIPKEAVISVLDTNQLLLEAEHQKEMKLNYEKYISESDIEKAKDTAFERQRLLLVTDYNKKYLQKAKRKVLESIMKINSEDCEKVNDITDVYQTRVEKSRQDGMARFYSQDTVLIAPINKLLVEYRHKRFELQPNLCVYWCLGVDDSPEAEAEEEEILQSLEYFKKTYDDILSNSLHKLEKHRTKLEANIEAIRPTKKPGTVVNVVAGSRIQSLEEIAELLLTQ